MQKKVQENTKHIITVSCVNITGNYIYLKDTKHNLSSSCHPCWHFSAKKFCLKSTDMFGILHHKEFHVPYH